MKTKLFISSCTTQAKQRSISLSLYLFIRAFGRTVSWIGSTDSYCLFRDILRDSSSPTILENAVDFKGMKCWGKFFLAFCFLLLFLDPLCDMPHKVGFSSLSAALLDWRVLVSKSTISFSELKYLTRWIPEGWRTDLDFQLFRHRATWFIPENKNVKQRWIECPMAKLNVTIQGYFWNGDLNLFRIEVLQFTAGETK